MEIEVVGKCCATIGFDNYILSAFQMITRATNDDNLKSNLITTKKINVEFQYKRIKVKKKKHLDPYYLIAAECVPSISCNPNGAPQWEAEVMKFKESREET